MVSASNNPNLPPSSNNHNQNQHQQRNSINNNNNTNTNIITEGSNLDTTITTHHQNNNHNNNNNNLTNQTGSHSHSIHGGDSFNGGAERGDGGVVSVSGRESSWHSINNTNQQPQQPPCKEELNDDGSQKWKVTPSPGAVSALASTKKTISLANGVSLQSDKVYVCKTILRDPSKGSLR